MQVWIWGAARQSGEEVADAALENAAMGMTHLDLTIMNGNPEHTELDTEVVRILDS